MTGFYIASGILGFFVLSFIIGEIITVILHKKSFGRRFTSDKRVTDRSYSKEEFHLDFTPVSVPLDGIQLKGYLYSLPGYDPKKIIIYAHGMWSSTLAYIQDIAYFCQKGYQVLALDHEGTDMSEGRSIRGLSNSIRCVDREITYVEEKYPGVGVYVAGHSWGGFATLNVVKYHPEVRGICAFAPFLSLSSQLKGMFPKPAWIILPFFLITERVIFGKYAGANAIKALRDYKGNAVVLASLNDPMVKYQYNTGILRKKAKNVHYIVNDGRFHTPHYSESAVKALMEYYKMNSSLSGEEKERYLSTMDFRALGELDPKIMDEAIEYLMK